MYAPAYQRIDSISRVALRPKRKKPYLAIGLVIIVVLLTLQLQ